MPSGFQAFGNAEGFVGSGAPPNVFPTIPTLVMRLESDLSVLDTAGAIDQWDDQVSAISFTALTTARPTFVANQIGTLPAVRFNGTTSVLVSNSLVSNLLIGSNPSTFKVVAVFKNNSAVSHATTSYDAPPVLCDSASFWSPLSADSTRINGGFFAGPDALASVVQAPGSLVYAECTLTAAAGGTLSLRVGFAGSPDSHPGVGTVGGVTGFLKLGCNYANAVFWQGDLFALYVATSMTAQNVTDLQTYLHSKYGVT